MLDSDLSSSPPRIPPKDSKRPQTPRETLVNTNQLPSFNNYSPPQPALWRRRSQKSENGVAFADLNLTKSNGSTASPEKGPLPSLPTQLPRSQGRKPLPTPINEDEPDMGNKLSKHKLKKKGSKQQEEWRTETGDQAKSPIGQDVKIGGQQNGQAAQTGQKRLPTPDYLHSDKQIMAPIVSPLSPVSPETPPTDNHKVDTLQKEKTNEGSLDSSTTIGPIDTTFLSHSREPSETLTITSPQPSKPFAAAHILTPQSPLLSSPKTPSSALHFPKLPKIDPAGTVLAPASLDITHFECFQKHAHMRSSRNDICPVGCMICQRKDKEQRWRCTWCCLSACGPCMRVLTSVEKDLNTCLTKIGG